MKDREKSDEFSKLKVKIASKLNKDYYRVIVTRIFKDNFSSLYAYYKSDKFDRFGEPARNARPARIDECSLVDDKRVLKRGSGCALICRNHEERWQQTSMTQFPVSLSELAHPTRARASPIMFLRSAVPLLPFIYLYVFFTQQISPEKKFQEKCRNLG